MKKLISLILALIMCLCACAGLAEDAAADESAGMEYFLAMMQAIPGMEEIDWVGFAEEFAAKQASGAEITLEDCLPANAWSIFGSMLASFGSDEEEASSEDSGISTEVVVTGNEMVATYKLSEQADKESVAQIAEAVTASFESEASLLTMKSSIESMAGAGIDLSKVAMTLKFLNADDSVIYEKTITYDDVKDLEAAPEEEPAA